MITRYPRPAFVLYLCTKGINELNSTALWASADLRAYRKNKSEFYLLNFWRAFPSEDPTATPHLRKSGRGQSVLWRGLRPELVRSNPVPLSPDANMLVTHDAPDWRKQKDDVLAATHRLVREVRSQILMKGRTIYLLLAYTAHVRGNQSKCRANPLDKRLARFCFPRVFAVAREIPVRCCRREKCPKRCLPHVLNTLITARFEGKQVVTQRSSLLVPILRCTELIFGARSRSSVHGLF